MTSSVPLKASTDLLTRSTGRLCLFQVFKHKLTVTSYIASVKFDYCEPVFNFSDTTITPIGSVHPVSYIEFFHDLLLPSNSRPLLILNKLKLVKNVRNINANPKIVLIGLMSGKVLIPVLNLRYQFLFTNIIVVIIKLVFILIGE